MEEIWRRKETGNRVGEWKRDTEETKEEEEANVRAGKGRGRERGRKGRARGS